MIIGTLFFLSQNISDMIPRIHDIMCNNIIKIQTRLHRSRTTDTADLMSSQVWFR